MTPAPTPKSEMYHRMYPLICCPCMLLFTSHIDELWNTTQTAYAPGTRHKPQGPPFCQPRTF